MIDSSVLHVLQSLQKHGETYISGGYLRDKLLNLPPKDVDLVTKIPFHELKVIIPNLQVTEQGEKVNVGRFQKHSILFEITSISGTIQDLVHRKDFTINTFFHDGKELYDFLGAEEDLKNRMIRPAEDFLSHTAERPQAYLRAIRITSKIDGFIDTPLLYLMKENFGIFSRNNDNRIRQEGYEILHSGHPQKGWNLLVKLGALTQYIKLPKPSVLFETQDTAFLIAYICHHNSKETMVEYMNLFKLKQSYLEEAEAILSIIKKEPSTLKPKELATLIKWNRYVHQNHPKKLQAFFDELKTFYKK